MKKKKTLQDLLDITNISDEDFQKLNWKEKQKYYNAKCKLGKICFVSRNKEGKGLTYRKKKQDEGV
ncbi:MAG: hypothetical protein IJ068_06705 [Bacilli bacterium]|nr:hypothetical protein [Bacilli bacterium]